MLFPTSLYLLTNVSNNITKEDVEYAHLILANNRLDTLYSDEFNTQLEVIKMVQNKVLEIAPQNKGIPYNQQREPKDLYENMHGLCYDRSRSIEKILKIIGFETRHAYSYKFLKDRFLPSILIPGVVSHALSEVKTSKGWMFIDSNDKFLGITENFDVVSLEDLSDIGYTNMKWSSYNNLEYQVVYKNDFKVMYGLYARHGKFYKPYNPLPDINWLQFRHNF